MSYSRITSYRNSTSDHYVICLEKGQEFAEGDLIETLETCCIVDGRTVYWSSTDKGEVKHKFKTVSTARQFANEIFPVTARKPISVYKTSLASNKVLPGTRKVGVSTETLRKYIKGYKKSDFFEGSVATWDKQ